MGSDSADATLAGAHATSRVDLRVPETLVVSQSAKGDVLTTTHHGVRMRKLSDLFAKLETPVEEPCEVAMFLTVWKQPFGFAVLSGRNQAGDVNNYP